MHARSILFGLALLLIACTPEPEPIRFGEEQGAFCKMTIADARFAAELVTRTSKVYKFDSIECLAGYYLAHPELHDQVHSLWVAGFQAPETWHAVDEAFFLRSPTLRSPMGANLTAFAPPMTPEAALNAFGGEILTWDDVLAYVAAHPMRLSRPTAHADAHR